MAEVRIGTAGWSIPKAVDEGFSGDGSHLTRYARVLRCAEINTSFHRSHRPEVYARWAAQTPDEWPQTRAGELRRWPAGTDRWCIFDNTASGAATSDALTLLRACR